MQQLRILWVSMLTSQLVFPVLSWVLADRSASAPDAVVGVLVGVGLLEAALSLAWGRAVALTPTPNRSIIRWAFAEAVTLSGFTLVFLGGPPLAGGCLMATGFVLILVQPPTEQVQR